jgi:hypothetical protein
MKFLVAKVMKQKPNFQMMSVKKERVIAYIDGFNLYFGMPDGRISKGNR